MATTRPSNEEILEFTSSLDTKLSKEDHDQLTGYVAYLVVTNSLLENESEFVDLLCEADDHEYPILERLGEKAGLLWRCYGSSPYYEDEICGALNYIGLDECSECRTPNI